jgi:hypothetical protein
METGESDLERLRQQVEALAEVVRGQGETLSHLIAAVTSLGEDHGRTILALHERLKAMGAAAQVEIPLPGSSLHLFDPNRTR